MEATCEVCGQHKEGVKKNQKTGKETCPKCYREFNAPKYNCTLCGELALASLITDEGKPVCARCRSIMKNRNLTLDKALENFDLIKPKVFIQHRSATKAHPIKGGVCEICGQEKKDVNKNRKTGKMTCYGCYVRHHCPKEICVICGKLKRVSARSEGRPACKGCIEHKIAREICYVCWKRKRVQTRDRKGRAICPRCAEKRLRGSNKAS